MVPLRLSSTGRRRKGDEDARAALARVRLLRRVYALRMRSETRTAERFDWRYVRVSEMPRWAKVTKGAAGGDDEGEKGKRNRDDGVGTIFTRATIFARLGETGRSCCRSSRSRCRAVITTEETKIDDFVRGSARVGV